VPDTSEIIDDDIVVRDRETIDSELRWLAAVRRVCRKHGGTTSIGPGEELLDTYRHGDGFLRRKRGEDRRRMESEVVRRLLIRRCTALARVGECWECGRDQHEPTFAKTGQR
jgi:hypothetical protein